MSDDRQNDTHSQDHVYGRPQPPQEQQFPEQPQPQGHPLEQMRLEPGRYRWVRVYAADLGEPGCQSWQVRPRLGLLGMLMGWWRVVVSSGCPLAT